jgi:hypothetical protein
MVRKKLTRDKQRLSTGGTNQKALYNPSEITPPHSKLSTIVLLSAPITFCGAFAG